MKKPSEHRNQSVLHVLIATFILLLFVTVGTIVVVVFSNWYGSVRQMTSALANKMNQDIIRQIDSFMQVPIANNNLNYRVIENGILNLSDGTARDRFFVGVLRSSNRDIYSFSYGTVDGAYYGARRNPDGAIEIMKNDASTCGESWYYAVKDDMTAGERVVNAGKFDPRARVWYLAAVQTGAPAFSTVYKHFVMDDMAISAAWPIYGSNRELKGVLGTHVLLSSIGNYLSNIVRPNSGYAVIVEKDTGYLIANSLGSKNFTVAGDDTLQRNTIDAIGNAAIEEAYQRYLASSEGNFLLGAKTGSLYVNIQEYRQPGLDWLILSTVPEEPFTRGVQRSIRLSILLMALSLLVLLFVYVIFTRRMLKPLNRLLNAMERFASGELSLRAGVARRDEIGRVSGVFNRVADRMQMLITNLAAQTDELQRTNDILEENREQLRLILDTTAEAICGVDQRGVCVFCNESCLKILGYARQEDVLGKDLHGLLHHSHRDGTTIEHQNCPIQKALQSGHAVHSSSEVFWRADGTSFAAEYNAVPKYKDGKFVRMVVTFTDITERKHDEEQIAFLSRHDPLTGLLNRRHLDNEMKALNREEALPISVLYVDLDGLKTINDTFGHTFGDELITKAAEGMRRCCRIGDVVARIGGDEFVILLPQTDFAEAVVIAGRLRAELSQQQIQSVPCSLSMGIATKAERSQKLETIMEAAEQEMYREKSGKNLDDDLPLVHRLVAIVEEYERALDREGHDARGRERALQAIEQAAGKRFDAQLAALFLRIMRR